MTMQPQLAYALGCSHLPGELARRTWLQSLRAGNGFLVLTADEDEGTEDED